MEVSCVPTENVLTGQRAQGAPRVADHAFLGHGTQAVVCDVAQSSITLVYVPKGHKVHSAMPGTEKDPSPQLVHDPLLWGLKDPARHCKQEA